MAIALEPVIEGVCVTPLLSTTTEPIKDYMHRPQFTATRNFSALNLLTQATRAILVLAILSLGSLSRADDNASAAKKQAAEEKEALNTAAATALVIETYRSVQSTKIEEDFQKEVQTCARLGDSVVAVDCVHQAAKRRSASLQKLAEQLGDLQFAYYRTASTDKEKSVPQLDMRGAADNLRGIAAASDVANVAPFEKQVVRDILRTQPEPLIVPRPRRVSLASSGPTTLVESAASMAQLVETRNSSLALLAVAAVLVVNRMLRLSPNAKGLLTRKLSKRT